MARDRKGVFQCTWLRCGKSFKRSSDLTRHYRIHTQERPYQCSVTGCSKGFIQHSALTVHSRTHTGEKPHVCNQDGCHKAFADSSSLARHRRVHTGIRPYECQEDLCCRRFCRKSTLEKHRRRSHPKRSLSPSPSEIRPTEKHHTEPGRPSTSNESSLLWQRSYDEAIAPNLGSTAQQDLQSIYLWGQVMLPPLTIWTAPAMQFFDMQRTREHYAQLFSINAPWL